MTVVTLIEDETNLGGVLTSTLAPTGLSFTARFFDTKTGAARTPQADTLTFTINKGNKKAERIRASGHSTDSDGVTTVTIESSGRSLPLYGTGAGSSEGNTHYPSDSVGCVTSHEPVSQLNDVFTGDKSTGGASFMIGRDTDENIYVYAANGDANPPFLGYLSSSNAWVFSNDGVSTTALANGSATYTAGQGLQLVASEFSLDLTDGIFFQEHTTYTPAFLTGGSSAESTAATWAALTNTGKFNMTIDGVAYTDINPDFTGDADMDDVAASIQAAIRAKTGGSETCVWSTNRFIISSADTTASSAITVASTPSTGTDISGNGGSPWMDCHTGTGVVTDAALDRTANGGDIVRLLATGYIDNKAINSDLLANRISDITVAASLINSIVGSYFLDAEALEAIDGSTTPKIFSVPGSDLRDAIRIYESAGDYDVANGAYRTFGNASATDELAQSFVYTDTLAETITMREIQIFLGKVASPTDNLTIEIQTDSSGVPSGTVITNGTSDVVAGSGLSSAGVKPVAFTWSTPPELTSGTTYHFVVKRSGAVDGTNHYRLKQSNTSSYSGGTASTYNSSTPLWTNQSYDLMAHILIGLDYDGKACLADANHIARANPNGLTASNVSAGQNIVGQIDGNIAVPGQIAGDAIFASTTPGAIDNDGVLSKNIDSPSFFAKIGSVIQDGQVFVQGPQVIADINDINMDNFVDTESGSFDMFIPTGGRPRIIEIAFTYFDVSATANQEYASVLARFLGTNAADYFYFEDMLDPTQLANGSSSVADFVHGSPSSPNNAVSIQSVHDNGFIMRITLNAAGDDFEIKYIKTET